MWKKVVNHTMYTSKKKSDKFISIKQEAKAIEITSTIAA